MEDIMEPKMEWTYLRRFARLYVGRRKGGDLIYAGKVDCGFDKANAKSTERKKVCHPFFRARREDL